MTCALDCNSSYIAINTTDGFFDIPIFSKVPTNWFYSNRTGPVSDGWFDLKSTIEHEMGHWLGFSDDQVGCNDTYSGLMETPLPPNTIRNLSDADRCMFEKLALSRIVWVIEFQLTCYEVNHIHKISHISISSCSSFSKLNFVVYTFHDSRVDSRVDIIDYS